VCRLALSCLEQRCTLLLFFASATLAKLECPLYSADWLFVAHSAFTQSIAIVTAYDTLGESGLLHSMNETEVEAIFTNADLLTTLLKVLPECPSLKHVIYSGEAKPEIVEKVKAQLGSVISLKELKALGRQYPRPPVPPKAEDICCIMYTSGSTGNPKGVILKHANLVAASKLSKPLCLKIKEMVV
jgi:long-chain acyl-CoA synthetase